MCVTGWELLGCAVILLTWMLAGPIIELYSARKALRESRKRLRYADKCSAGHTERTE